MCHLRMHTELHRWEMPQCPSQHMKLANHCHQDLTSKSGLNPHPHHGAGMPEWRGRASPRTKALHIPHRLPPAPSAGLSQLTTAYETWSQPSSCLRWHSYSTWPKGGLLSGEVLGSHLESSFITHSGDGPGAQAEPFSEVLSPCFPTGRLTGSIHKLNQ